MGREFVDLFDRWADNYDDTVAGFDEEYQAVFQNYDQILKEVAERATGHVLEFGVGTGNLSAKLLSKTDQYTGIEPSEKMREIAEKKVGVPIFNGDFMSFPEPKTNVDTIVSSYAFHHLTHKEKNEAVAKYHQLLSKSGKVIFADTVFLNEAAKNAMIIDAKAKQYVNLAEDLLTEYYPTVAELTEIFEKNNFRVSFKKLNEFVWLFEGIK